MACVESINRNLNRSIFALNRNLGCIYHCSIIQIVQRHLERGNIRVEFRLQLSTVVMGHMVGFRDFLKAAALSLHIAQSAENIRKDGIAARGGNAGQIPFLYPCAVRHTTGRIDGESVMLSKLSSEDGRALGCYYSLALLKTSALLLGLCLLK